MNQNGNKNNTPQTAGKSRQGASKKRNCWKYEITFKEIDENDVSGTVNNYGFSARVHNGEQKYGIYGGRVSKLLIWDKKTVGVVMDYERGWRVKPLNGDIEGIMLVLVQFFNSAPNIEELPALEGDTITITKHYEKHYDE